MRAGQLRESITIEAPTKIKDGQGGNRIEWNPIITTKASIWPVSGSQRVQHQQLENEITHRIRTRYQYGINGNMRIKYGTRIFHIEGQPINIEERNRTLEFLCREEVVL